MHNVPLAEAGAVLTIDLDALASNWRLLAARVRPALCAAVVKADAYGIGIERAVPALAKAGCRTFFVAHASEGRRVREALPEQIRGVRIYVLNGIPPDIYGADALAESGLRPVLSSLEAIGRWNGFSERNAVGLPAALHIDTGMNRLGIALEEIDTAKALVAKGPYPALATAPGGFDSSAFGVASSPPTNIVALRKTTKQTAPIVPPGVYLDLVMSHFVSSENPDDPLNWRQTNTFRKAAEQFPGISASLANSSGIFLPHQPVFDLVRPGYALYGGNPVPGAPNPMRPVITLTARILQVHRVPAGGTVGYNSEWTAQRDTQLATIGIGYADGFPRLAGSTDARRDGAEVMLAGKRCRIVGRVSMDLTVIDVTEAPAAAVQPGAAVEVLNRDITIDDLASYAGNSGYTVLTGLGARYHRVYVGG